uniref:Uncharacterized protein n=1 Tax=Rhizophora mucronata TaxID=61149 RepID=A0A2P2PNQ6_RHIMU
MGYSEYRKHMTKLLQILKQSNVLCTSTCREEEKKKDSCKFPIDSTKLKVREGWTINPEIQTKI